MFLFLRKFINFLHLKVKAKEVKFYLLLDSLI